MMDLIIGMGQVGSTLYTLFISKGIKCAGFDKITTRNRNYPPQEKLEVLHIACPYFDGFIDYVLETVSLHKPQCTMIHSTVPIGTGKKIQGETDCRIVSAPARGRHDNFLEDMIKYTKFYAFDGEESNIRDIMSARFNNFKRAESNTALEMAKIMCDTTYLGLLVAYRKYVDSLAEQYDIKDKDRMWEFAKEAHERYGNRPILYNDGKKIGGHCVLQNLDLLTNDFNEVVGFIEQYGGTV